jgi:UDP-glucuronate 4-epimerase
MGSKPSIIISGAGGFIGSHLIKRLCESHSIYAFDKLEKPQSIERAKLSPIPIHKADLHGAFWPEDRRFDLAIHLAAETGVGPSDDKPELYWKQNVLGTERMAKACRDQGVTKMIYASSSSVYSPNQAIMSETSCTQHPVSYYGKTKKEAEMRMETLCRDSQLCAIGLRFFTVYGSQVRSDMAAAKFIEKLKNGEPITLYNNGEVERDFTHVSDVCEAIARLIPHLQQFPQSEHRIFNIGRGKPTSVLAYAQQIARALDVPLNFISKPLPKNELMRTHSDSSALYENIQFQPAVDLKSGISEMVNGQLL